MSGGYSSLQCSGFSLQWLHLLWSIGSKGRGLSSYGLQNLQHWLSSCGAQAQLLHGTWDLSGPGIEPMYPAGPRAAIRLRARAAWLAARGHLGWGEGGGCRPAEWPAEACVPGPSRGA